METNDSFDNQGRIWSCTRHTLLTLYKIYLLFTALPGRCIDTQPLKQTPPDAMHTWFGKQENLALLYSTKLFYWYWENRYGNGTLKNIFFFFFLFSQKEELNLQWKEQNNLIQYYRAACKQLPPHVIIDGDRDEYLHWKSAARKVNFKIAWPFSSSFKNLSFLLNYKDYVACLIDYKLHILKCNLTVT